MRDQRPPWDDSQGSRLAHTPAITQNLERQDPGPRHIAKEHIQLLQPVRFRRSDIARRGAFTPDPHIESDQITTGWKVLQPHGERREAAASGHYRFGVVSI